MKWSSVRLSIRLCPVDLQQQRRSGFAGSRYRSTASGAGAAYQLQARRAAGAGAQRQIGAVSC